jgi:hypothetical protein
MTYLASETSIQDGSPCLLFAFSRYNVTTRYTTIAEEIEYNGYTYAPAVIKMSDISASNDFARDALKLTVPIDSTIAATYIGGVPDGITALTVFRAHTDDTETVVAWSGRVSSIETSGQTMVITCESIYSALGRKMLRRQWTRQCPHPLFGKGCNLTRATFATTISATSTSARGTIIVSAGASALTGLVGGTLMGPDGFRRTIIAHSGTSITLIRENRALTALIAAGPTNVSVAPGCGRTLEACAAYGNRGNFGGWAGIPVDDPLEHKLGRA